MATPVTIRQRDAAIERNKQRRSNNNKQQRPQHPNHDFTTYRNSNNNNNTSNYSQVQRPLNPPSTNVDFAQDVDIRNFVDFDDWVGQPMRASQASLSKMTFKEITINKDDVFFFHGKDHYLSTFYEAPFELLTHKYPTVETYYEACKLYCLVNGNCASMIQKAKNAAQSKKIASNILRDRQISRKAITQWKWTNGYHAVYNGTLQKFCCNPELKKQLLDTGNKFLIHSYDKDDIFASGCSQNDASAWLETNHGKTLKIPMNCTFVKPQDITKVGKGCNLLGYICMRIRSELRESESQQQPDEITINSLDALTL